MNTQKRTVIVTRGSRGIGQATSLAFAKKGYNVVISARNENSDLLREIKQLGGEATFIKADVSKEEDVINLINETVKKYGKLDVLVNNAGIVGTMNLLLAETINKNFKQVFDINVLGTYWGMKYAIQAMLKTGGGNIVNLSSIAGLKGVPSASNYTASKHAVMGLTKATAIEYATKGIKVNVVAPGPIRTDMYDDTVSQGGEGGLTAEFFESMVPMKKVSDVEDVANAIVFMSSTESPFMTGAVLTIDGGLCA